MRPLIIAAELKAKKEFPTFFAAKVEFEIEYLGAVITRTFWLYFIDGYEAKHAFNLN